MDSAPLIERLINGTLLIYEDISKIVVYPLFTVLFVFFITLGTVVTGFSAKKILKSDFNAGLKLLTCAAILFFVAADAYMIAHGEDFIFLLFLKFQKDLLLLFTTFALGIGLGFLLKKKSDYDEVLP